MDMRSFGWTFESSFRQKWVSALGVGGGGLEPGRNSRKVGKKLDFVAKSKSAKQSLTVMVAAADDAR